MAGIEKGTEAAQATYRLLENWTEWSERRFGESEAQTSLGGALDGAMSFASEVVYNLIVIVGGAINAVAMQAELPFEDVLASIWQQLASQGTDNHDAQVMRTAVTAWTSGSAMDAHFVNESGILAEVQPTVLMMHFAGVWTMLARKLTEHAGEPLDNALEGVRLALGIEE